MRNSLVKMGLLISLMLAFSLTHQISPAYANSVIKTKGRNVLIKMSNQNFKVGEYYYTVDSKGKKKGIVQIAKKKGLNAIAVLKKGSAIKGQRLEIRTPPAKKSVAQKAPRPQKNNDTPKASPPSNNSATYGLMLGFSQDAMSVDLGDANGSVDLEGTGSSAKGFFDYPLFSVIWFRMLLGLENFSVESNDTNCGEANNETCVAEISYLSIDLWGRLMFNPDSSFRVWVGGGFDLLFPSTSDATAITSNSITNTSVMAFGGGADLVLGGGSYIIPIQIEYGLFPSSEEVEASYIAARLGFGMKF